MKNIGLWIVIIVALVISNALATPIASSLSGPSSLDANSSGHFTYHIENPDGQAYKYKIVFYGVGTVFSHETDWISSSSYDGSDDIDFDCNNVGNGYWKVYYYGSPYFEFQPCAGSENSRDITINCPDDCSCTNTPHLYHTDLGDCRYRLTWSLAADDMDCVDYIIVYEDGHDVAHVSSENYYTVNLEPGEEHDYKLRARSTSLGCYGDYSNIVTLLCCPDLSEPDDPSVSTRCGYVRVSWDEVDGATGYRLERDPDDGFGTKTVTSTHYNDDSVEIGTGYKYRVQVIGPEGCGDSPWSDWSRRRGPDREINIAPTNFRATEIGPDTVALVWSFPADEYMWNEEYCLYWSTSNSRPSSPNADPNDNRYVVRGLSSNTIYYFWVSGYNHCGGCADYYATVVCTTKSPLIAPSTVIATRQGCDSVEVVWTGVSEADCYNVFRGTSNTFSSAETLATGITDTFYYDTSAPPDNDVWYWVQSVQVTEVSSESVPDSASMFPLPGPILNIVATADDSLDDRIHLIWTQADNGAYYKIYRAPELDSAFSVIDSVFAPETSYTDSGLYANEDYYYFVEPVNICGLTSGTTSDTVGDTTTCFPPAIPELSGESYPDSVVLSWSSVPCDYYILVRAFYGLSEYDTIYVGPLCSYTDVDVIEDSTYDYRVCAVNECGAGEFSDPLIISIPTGTLEPPNPVSLEYISPLGWGFHKFAFYWNNSVPGADGYVLSFSRMRGNFFGDNIPRTIFESPPYYKAARRIRPGDPYFAYARAFALVGGDTIFSNTSDTAAANRPVGGHYIAILKRPLNNAIFYQNDPPPTFEWYRTAETGVSGYKLKIYEHETGTEVLSADISPTDSTWTISSAEWDGMDLGEYEWTIATCYSSEGCFEPYTKWIFRRADSTSVVVAGEVDGVYGDTSASPEIEMDVYTEDDLLARITSPFSTVLDVAPNGAYSVELPPLFPGTHYRVVLKPDFSGCEYTEFPTFTAADAMLTKRFVSGSLQFSPQIIDRADVNNDGIVDSVDCAFINARAVDSSIDFEAGTWCYNPESTVVTIYDGISSRNDFYVGLYGDVDGSIYYGTFYPDMPQTDDISIAILVIDTINALSTSDSIMFNRVPNTDSTYTPDSIGSFTLHLQYDPSVLNVTSITPAGPFSSWHCASHINPTQGVASLACYCDVPIPTPSEAVVARFSFSILRDPTGTSLRLPKWEITDFNGVPAVGYVKMGGCPPLGVAEQGKTQLPLITDVHIVPNPFNASFTVRFTAFVDTRLEIFDIYGRKVYEENFNISSNASSQTIVWDSGKHLPDLLSGIYFIKINAGETNIIRRVYCIK